jgi:Na+-translocating ferredoxin:NAD+ oxidoreductase RNF subunit RnfB
VVQVILYAVLALGAIGIAAAIILYFVSQKFKVIEDPRIDEVAEQLPGANCGGCGYAGCRNFAEAIVNAGNMDNLSCPVGGNVLSALIGPILGIEVVEKEPTIAVVRCNGTKTNAPAKAKYDSAQTCAFANSLFSGESGCPNGCLGCGDCVAVCIFDAIYMDEVSGLPIVIDDKCVSCGACVKACPRNIIEIRPKGKKDRRIYVNCINKEKGAISRKNCSVACIGCGKCVKTCTFDAITMTNNIAYIDPIKCKLCRKCAAECPTGAIVECNFPPRKEKEVISTPENNEL